MFTVEQRTWLNGFITKPAPVEEPETKYAPPDEDGPPGIVAGLDWRSTGSINIPAEPPADNEAPPNGRPPPPGGRPPGPITMPGEGATKGFIDLPKLEDVTDMTSSCIFANKTAQRLSLDPKSLKPDHGKLTRNPDPVIEPGGQANWSVENTKAPSWIPVIGGMSASGCEGHIKYLFPDGQSSVTCHFKATFSGNFPLLGSGNNERDIKVEGPLKATIEGFATGGDGADGLYNFEVRGPGGGTPTPGPTPGGATQANASCLVTIVNATAAPITLADQANELGDFMGNPPSTIAPGGSGQFAYVQTPGGKEPGCQGACTYMAGEPPAASWRVEWTNPVGAKNTAVGTLTPESAGFASLEQSGQGDENVPFTFTLSGGPPAGPIDPGPIDPGPIDPGPVVPPEPEPEFVPPPSGKQPTLRKGDKNTDGWVEYLQEALNTNGSVKVPVNGDFDAGTLKAVLAFQTAKKLLVDGTVGNQTWAALRDGTPEAPSTDGRTPHTYKEEGKEARFFTEKDPVMWFASGDTLTMDLVSVGDTKADGKKVVMRVTAPGSKPRVAEVALPSGQPIGGAEQGARHFVEVQGFTAKFPSTPPGSPGSEYLVEAYLEKELGGDKWNGNPVPG